MRLAHSPSALIAVTLVVAGALGMMVSVVLGKAARTGAQLKPLLLKLETSDPPLYLAAAGCEAYFRTRGISVVAGSVPKLGAACCARSV